MQPDVQHSDERSRCYRADPRHPHRVILASGEAHEDAPDLAAAAIHGAFRAFVDDTHHPCVGAKSAVHTGSYRLGVYDALGGLSATRELGRDLRRFVADAALAASDYATFVAVFESPLDAAPVDFESLLWKQLRRLHGVDDAPWNSEVSADPEDPHFSFSFAETAFYVIGMSPHSERLSRRFPWPALVFNPHAQFERLRESGKWARMKEVIRERDVSLQGSINPALEDFGEQSEARQYAGRAIEPDWRAPFRARLVASGGPDAVPPSTCPYHVKKAG